jgi:hypothetical protein
MKPLLRRNQQPAEHWVQDIGLTEAFQPVSPREEFVRNLNFRVRNDFPAIRRQIQENKRIAILIFTASFATILLAVFTAARMLITLTGMVGLLLQLKQPEQSNAVISTRRER